MQTGDILLFHGEGWWFSRAVEWLTGSRFSHVSMILRNPTYIHPSLTGLFMIESGEEKFPDAVRHRVIKGVQIVDLEKVIENYQGSVYHRALDISAIEEIRIKKIFAKLWEKIEFCPYDQNPWDFFKVLFDLDIGNNYRENSYFCSALIASLYERFGFFKEPIPWDLVQPKDFDEGLKIDQILKIQLEPKKKL